MKTNRKILLSIIFVIFVISVLYIKFGGDKLYKNNISSITIDLPTCFLPNNDTELNFFLNGIKNDINWSKSTNSNKLDGVIAYRTFNFKNQEVSQRFGMVNINSSSSNVKQYHIALIDKKNVNDFIKRIEERGLNKMSAINCKDATGKLYITNDFVTVPISNLIIFNDFVGLYIMEASNDEKREFTKSVLETVRKEFTTNIK